MGLYGFARHEPMYLYRIAFFFYGPIGFVMTLSVGLLVSFVTGLLIQYNKLDIYCYLSFNYIHWVM